jgi:hypothetical protein
MTKKTRLRHVKVESPHSQSLHPNCNPKKNPHTDLSKKPLSKAATQIRDGVWERKKRFHTIVSGFIPDGSSGTWVPWSTPVGTLQTHRSSGNHHITDDDDDSQTS